VYPVAWVDPRTPGAVVDAEACKERARTLLSGSLLDAAAIDLNDYHVLVLNRDATLSVIDPRFSYGGSRLLALVDLRSPGADWALTADQRRLFVSLPDSDRIAVVDTSSYRVTAEIAVGTRPTRVVLQPDGGYLWVAVDGGVSVVSVADPRKVADLALGAGRHQLALADDSRTAFVTSDAARRVAVVDVATLAVRATIDLPAAPTGLDYSAAAGAAYVTCADGTIVVVDAATARRTPAAQLTTAPGLAGIAFAPRGRLGFAFDTEHRELYVIDPAQNRVVQHGSVESGPDQITFSDTLAFIRHRDSETVLMVPLDQVGQPGERIPVADFPGGQHPPGPAPLPTSIARAPGAAAMLVANPLDKAVYYYKEGMAAPMGNFEGYGHAPVAVLAIDRSLRERTPGVYETVSRFKAPGSYNVLVLLDAPRVLHCFPLEIAAQPGWHPHTDGPVTIEPLWTEAAQPAGRKARLRFRVRDAATEAPRDGLTDLVVQTFLAPGVWHERRPATAEGGGVYAADVEVPQPGAYYVSFEAASIGLRFNAQQSIFLARPGDPGTVTPEAR
ncbi:MAG TPA: YncE family protein, partial [Kofleriaceae bacterium]|nr:YncE family protein [Kofleriaceae bacterium]